jgi:FKBP-type peptidyl-prolyl cis-trans isomerase
MSTWSNAEETPADDKGPELKTTSAQASYGIGLSIGRELQRQGILEIDVDALAQGLRDTFGEAKPRLTQAQISEALQAFEKEMSAKAAEKRKVLSEKNVREGKAFLDANKKKDGVVTLESGLQYKVLKKGEGPSPKKTDRVTTHYHGTFIGGKVFDSSVERNEPATFGVGGVIPGWTEALQLMKVGDKWRLFVPSDLAYGPDGRGDIGPHSVLIFDVELLGIE